MRISNVHPATLDILTRQRCVILTTGGGIPTTIPVERILSLNKNTMIIDNADHTIVRQEHYSFSNPTDFIGACILRIEPTGNIFVAEIRIDEDMIQQAVNTNQQQSDSSPDVEFPIKSANTELIGALRMAIEELIARRMGPNPNGQSRYNGNSTIFPPQMMPNPFTSFTSQFLQNNPNQPIPHRMPFSVPAFNTPPCFVVKQKDQFSRPAAFGPSQSRSNPLGQSPTWLPYGTPPELAPMMANIQYYFGPMASAFRQAAHQPTIQKDEEDLCRDPKTRISEQDLRQKAKEPETIDIEAQYVPTDSCKNTRMETANHISGMINAILSSGNTKGALPVNDGPVAAFVNGNGDVILSYSDGSISPAINPEAIGVNQDEIDGELQDIVSKMPMPAKAFNPNSQL